MQVLETPFRILEPITKRLYHLYKSFETYLLNGEQDENLIVKKKVAIFNFVMMLSYFLTLKFQNPNVSFKPVLFHVFFASLSFYIIRTKKFSFFVMFFISSYIFGLYVASWKYENGLKILGLALIQHNQSFLLHDSKYFKPFLMIVTFVIIYYSQAKLTRLIDNNEIEKIIEIVKGIQCTWVPLYIYNQLGAMEFSKKYLQIVHKAKEANKHLEKINNELFMMNGKQKETLSLLEDKNKELKEAITNRELFIASVSHEFRNPLNSMLGNIELLSLETQDPKWREMLNTCKFCCDVLLGMINNVLDVAKINASKLELNIQPTNIYGVIEKVWSVGSVSLREKGLTGSLHFPKNFPQYLEMDSHRLNQILLNLIGNAIKFTKKGFVKVIISWHQDKKLEDLRKQSSEFLNHVSKNAILSTKAQPKMSKLILSSEGSEEQVPSLLLTDREIIDSHTVELKRSLSKRILAAKTMTSLKDFTNSVSLNEKETNLTQRISPRENTDVGKGFLKIEILDSGCGIPQASINRLFQPFSQADPSITRQFGGTGLGLYITKQLVQKMDGEIDVYSYENIGSNFSVIIPTKTTNVVSRNGSCDDEDFKVPQNTESKKPIALVVDDINLNQQVMTQYLKKLNIQAEVANNGLEALQKFKEKGLGYYQFITMDIQMPVMDGLTASKEIRNYENLVRVVKKTPIIIVTGNCTETERKSCLDPDGEIQASYFFRKPFVFDECKSSIEVLFGKGSGSRMEIRSTIASNC